MKQASSQLKSVPSLDEDDISSQRLPFSVGAWIESWFPSHQKYYCGKLTKQRDHDCWQVEYLDGSCQWMLLSKERICVIAAADSLAAKDYDERRRLLAHLKIGSRVEVFWEPYDTWFSGTVKQIKSGMEEEYLIAYDIKNETWEKLFSESFRLLGNAMIGTEQAAPLSDDTAAPESFSAGARIAVFFSDDQGGQFYPGTVTTGNVNSKGEINVAFDDGEVLDLVLAEEEYKILPDQSKKRKLASDKSNDGMTTLSEDVCEIEVSSSLLSDSRSVSRDGESLTCIPINQDFTSVALPDVKVEQGNTHRLLHFGASNDSERSNMKSAHQDASNATRSKCTVKDCQNDARREGVCIAHGANSTLCTFAGCHKRIFSKLVCRSHGPRKVCAIANCRNLALQGNVCRSHGNLKNRVKICVVADCPNQAKVKGLCQSHSNLQKDTDLEAA